MGSSISRVAPSTTPSHYPSASPSITPLNYFLIASLSPSSKKWCLMPKTNRNRSIVVIKERNSNFDNQLWKTDNFGRIMTKKTPVKCLFKRGKKIILNVCGGESIKKFDRSRSFLYSPWTNKIHWVKNSSLMFQIPETPIEG